MRGLELGERATIYGGAYHGGTGVYLGVRPDATVAFRLDARERVERYAEGEWPSIVAEGGGKVGVGTTVRVLGGRAFNKLGVFEGITPERELRLRLTLPEREIALQLYSFSLLLREPPPFWRNEPSAHTLRRLLKRINAPATRAELHKARVTVSDRTSFRHITPHAREAAATTHAVYDQIDRSDPENWRPTSGSVACWAACVRHNKRAAARRTEA